MGYELHANTFAAARNKTGLERLCRYVARAPVDLSRLEERADGQVVLHLKRPWADGTTATVMSAAELVAALVALRARGRRSLHSR